MFTLTNHSRNCAFLLLLLLLQQFLEFGFHSCSYKSRDSWLFSVFFNYLPFRCKLNFSTWLSLLWIEHLSRESESTWRNYENTERQRPIHFDFVFPFQLLFFSIILILNRIPRKTFIFPSLSSFHLMQAVNQYDSFFPFVINKFYDSIFSSSFLSSYRKWWPLKGHYNDTRLIILSIERRRFHGKVREEYRIAHFWARDYK